MDTSTDGIVRAARALHISPGSLIVIIILLIMVTIIAILASLLVVRRIQAKRARRRQVVLEPTPFSLGVPDKAPTLRSEGDLESVELRPATDSGEEKSIDRTSTAAYHEHAKVSWWPDNQVESHEQQLYLAKKWYRATGTFGPSDFASSITSLTEAEHNFITARPETPKRESKNHEEFPFQDSCSGSPTSTTAESYPLTPLSTPVMGSPTFVRMDLPTWQLGDVSPIPVQEAFERVRQRRREEEEESPRSAREAKRTWVERHFPSGSLKLKFSSIGSHAEV